MGAFSDSIRSQSNRVLSEVNQKGYKIAKELFSLTVQLTQSKANPGKFAEGYLANQWWPNTGKVFNVAMDGSASPNGSGSLQRISTLAGTEFLGKDGALTLANNVPYSFRAEYLGWPAPLWSGGATGAGYQGTGGPYRMVAMSIQTVAAKYK